MLSTFLLSVVLSAPPVPPVQAVAFRTRLTIGDPDRNWTYITASDQSLDPIWTINGKPYQSWSLPAVDCWYDAAIHGGFILPADAKPGELTINCGHPITVQVVKPLDRKVVTITTSMNAIQVTSAASVAGEIILQPGLHQWDRVVVLPANTIVRGYGATVKRLPGVNYGTNWPMLLIGGQDVSVYGVTFVNDNPGGMVFFGNPPQAGLVVADCCFRRCNLGFYFTNSLVRDCTFESGGSVIAPGGLFWRCRFIGPSLIDPWQGWVGVGPFQMIDCTFDKTSRGPVFNAGGGSINDSFFAGVECHGIVRGNNGNECWLCESGPVNRFVALHCRVVGCDSSSFQFDGGCTDCYVRDYVQRGGFGIILTSWNKGATATNFVVQDFELSGCGLYLGPTATGCGAIDGSIIGYMPTRGNQTWQNPSPLSFPRIVAALADGPSAGTNTLTRVSIIGLPTGFTGVQGFTVK